MAWVPAEQRKDVCLHRIRLQATWALQCSDGVIAGLVLEEKAGPWPPRLDRPADGEPARSQARGGRREKAGHGGVAGTRGDEEERTGWLSEVTVTGLLVCGPCKPVPPGAGPRELVGPTWPMQGPRPAWPSRAGLPIPALKVELAVVTRGDLSPSTGRRGRGLRAGRRSRRVLRFPSYRSLLILSPPPPMGQNRGAHRLR